MSYYLEMMLMICTLCCRIVEHFPFRRSQLSVPFNSRLSGLDVLLEFLNAEVTVSVQFGESLPHPQGSEAG